jgi:hypothetical protein
MDLHQYLTQSHLLEVVVRVVTIHLTLKEMVTLEDQAVAVVQDQVFTVELVEQEIHLQ